MSKTNEHKPGYKHTPLGWIPEGWEVKEVGQMAKISSGGTPDRKRLSYWNGSIPWISTSLIDFNTITKAAEFITEEGLENSSAKLFEPGTILMAMYGQGKTRGKVAKLGLQAATNQACAAIMVDGQAEVDFLFQYFIHNYNNIRRLSNTGSQENLNGELIKSINIKLPTNGEQRRIATILSTWDEAFTKIQQLITQLHQRNKGLMQLLLTGKKRLKGFEDKEWKKLHATDIFKSVSVKNNGTERLLSATQDRGIIPRDMLEARVTMPAGETDSFKLVEIGDFVISLRSFQGGIEYSEYRGLVSPAYTVLKPTKSINTSFFKHYFKSYDFIGHLAVAVIGIRDGKQVSYEDFSILKLPYPSIDEQEAIANVLDEAVEEVKLFEQKLTALQQQKKGLMQKLLTGEVRVKL